MRSPVASSSSNSSVAATTSRRSNTLSIWCLFLVSIALISTVKAQDIVTSTVTNADGTLATQLVYNDANGDPTSTSVLVAPVTTTTTVANQGQVGAPPVLCTTAGCPALPTTYTVGTTIGGQSTQVILTWFATTPTIPIPTWTSSGSIEPLASYITTTITVKNQAGAGTSLSSHPWFITERTTFVLGAIIAGLVGALIVL